MDLFQLMEYGLIYLSVQRGILLNVFVVEIRPSGLESIFIEIGIKQEVSEIVDFKK